MANHPLFWPLTQLSEILQFTQEGPFSPGDPRGSPVLAGLQIIKPMALDVVLTRGSCASFVQMPSPHQGVALLAQEMQGEVSVPWSDGDGRRAWDLQDGEKMGKFRGNSMGNLEIGM